MVSAKTNGATPLVLSCRNGHHDVVEYLVDKCCASVEQPGSVTFDGETIEGAPPLWCAAAAGTQIENIFYAPVDTFKIVSVYDSRWMKIKDNLYS